MYVYVVVCSVYSEINVIVGQEYYGKLYWVEQ